VRFSAAFAALLLLPAVRAAALSEDSWTVDETAHFVIHHENPAAVLGDYNRIEQIYDTLHSELWTLVPWMTREKTNIYIYKDPATYRAGRFHPPAWSGGLLQTSGPERALAVYEPLDTGIVAHELTHLYFHAFFDEKKTAPPAWLDEGLASMLQAQALSLPDPRDKGPILRGSIPLTDFVRSRPGNDAPSAWVGGWYAEAQSVTWYLKRGRIEASFADFCGKLRDGADVQTALRESYGFDDLAAFDGGWQNWRPTKAPGMLKGIGDR
jgi:hypothetical protein